MKYAWIAAHCDLFPVARMCRTLAVSRSGDCQWRARPESERSKANSALDAQVAAPHAGSGPTFGRPRIAEDLGTQSAHCGKRGEDLRSRGDVCAGGCRPDLARRAPGERHRGQ